MQGRDFEYEYSVPGITRRQVYDLQAASSRYGAASYIFYPTRLLCIIFAMSTLLRRVSDHASHSYYNTARDHADPLRSSTVQRFDCRDCVGQYTLYYWVRSMHKIAMLLCSLSIAAGIVAAGFRAEIAVFLDQAATATDAEGKETKASKQIFEKIQLVGLNSSLGALVLLETLVLVLVTSGFLLFFPAIIVMFHRVEQRLHSLLQEMCLRSDHGTAFLPFEFSPRAADGSETQTEMQIVDARQYLRDIQSSAAAQRRRFLLCLVFVMAALVALVAHAIFAIYIAFNGSPNAACGFCDLSCQRVPSLMFQWYNATPELLPLVVSLGSSLPLLFSLAMMTTPEDRALLMNSSTFRTEEISRLPVETERDARLRAERIRMGINLL